MSVYNWMQQDIKPLQFVKTGSVKFDSLVGGFLLGDVSIIAGYTKSGKSLVGLNLAAALTEQKNYVLYISCENKIQIDMDRLKKITHIDPTYLYYYNSSEDGNPSASTLIQEIMATLDVLPYKFVFIDGIEYAMKSTGDAYSNSQNINEDIKTLVNYLKSKDVGIIMTWQINRTGADKALCDYNGSEIQSSLSVVQNASHTFVVKKWKEQLPLSDCQRYDVDGNPLSKNKIRDLEARQPSHIKWQLRLVLSRTEINNWDRDTIDLNADYNSNEFSLFDMNILINKLENK